jgi:hypothetical protein
MLDAFVTCLTFDEIQEMYPESSFPTLERWRKAFLQSLFGNHVSEDTAKFPELLNRFSDTLNTVLNQAIAAFDGGYVGLVEPSALEGKRQLLQLTDQS